MLSLQVASRPSSLGRGACFSPNRSAALIVLALLAIVAMSASSSRAQVAPNCTISASVSGYDATFSGAISGSFLSISWTLHFGDGGSVTGTGSSVSTTHSYSAFGTYTATLDFTGTYATGGSVSGLCSTRVVIQPTYSVSAQESVAVSDNVTYIPPLHLADAVSILDRPGNLISVLLNDAATIADSPLLTGPGSFNELANVTDSAVVSLGSNGGLNPTLLVTVIAVGVVGAAIVAWRLLLSRPPAR